MPGVHSETIIENIVPILNVKDVRVSVEWYEEILGLKEVEWGKGGRFTSVGRDGWGMYLCEGAQGQPGMWIWVGVPDVQVLYEELMHREASILLPPTNFGHALEMRVEDPDGHVLRFGSDSRSDLPIEPMIY